MTIRPLKVADDIHTPEKFREYVETLEVARELLEAGTPARVRLGLIVLDNIAEILMYRLCSNMFRSDEYLSRILPPRFSKRVKTQVLWKFPEKVRLLKAEGVLTDSDVAVLAAAHSSRNQAAHHDAHNPRGGRAIAALMLGTVGRLLAATGRGVTVGGFRSDEIQWLGRYGLPTGHIEFSTAALAIADTLARGLPTGIEDVRAAMLTDLTERLEALRTFPDEYLYTPSDADLAEMLRLEEFHATFDEEAVAAEYREATYVIAQGGAYPPDEFRHREERYKETLGLERERFRPTLTVMELHQLSDWVARLQSAGSVLHLLEVYVGADRRFTAYESVLTSAALRLDGATMPLHFEPRLLELHIEKDAIDQAFKELTGNLSDLDKDQLAKTAAKMAVLVKTPERIQKVCADIARHFQEKVAPSGFGAQVVTFDRASCVLYKEALDEYLPPEVSDIVMTVNSGETEYAPFRREREAEEKLLDRFRDPADPLKILIVTSKLLTGFDAPILQAMYLDKPLRDHTLLQAICRTNRPYGEAKTHGLIVDYLGVFDDVAQAIQFDEEGITRVVANINELVDKLPGAVQKCLVYFPGVDRTVIGYEGLIAAQDCLPNNDTRDRFAANYSYLSRLWEAISPDPVLSQHETDYRWLTHVYESVKPSTGTGKLLWHALGPKTIELIHQHVHVDAIRDDLETLVLDADLLEAVLGTPDPNKKAKEIEIKVARHLRKRLHDPRFKALGERLEALKQKHEQGLLLSIDFLKALLDLARDVVAAEHAAEPIGDEELGKAALTELFKEAKNEKTPIMVERVVNDIDEIVRYVRFDGWQNTHAGEREVKMALRKTLFKYKLHQDQELFDRAYGYIRQYY